jgi:hypothetical protein
VARFCRKVLKQEVLKCTRRERENLFLEALLLENLFLGALLASFKKKNFEANKPKCCVKEARTGEEGQDDSEKARS